jgi:hypothetical protein
MGEADLSRLTLEALAAQCAQEAGAYLRGSCDSRFGYELFRRAIQEGTPGAWDALVQIYTPFVAGWVARHPHYAQAHETVDFFVNGAFARLAYYMTAEKFQLARDLAAILKYLKLCAHSEIEEYVERLMISEQDPDQESPGEDRQPHFSEPDVDEMAFWQWIETRLHSTQERRVILGLFRLGLKPKELYNHFPNEFRDVCEIYRITENVLARLRRDPQMGRWSTE